MEKSSASLAVSGASGSSDSSLNGLKFGQKIYFEDVGIGVSAKSGCGSSSVSVSVASLPAPTLATGRPRKGRGFVQGGHLPRCQVEGCKVDLSGAKAYYSRHKVCGMHSKSPKVVVAGLEQRFCQQCSRFHLLPEFDQGKRSCRRRLAGHNERRRKPPSGSLLSSRFGRLSSSFHEDSSQVGSFLMEYPRLPRRDAWPPYIRAGDWASGNQPPATEKFIPHLWSGSSDNPPGYVFSHASHPYLQDSVGGMVVPSPGVPPGECFTGVSDSSCALSLLSTQPWGSRNQASGLAVNNFMTDEGVPMVQSTAPHCALTQSFTSNAWGFKGNETSSSSPGMPSDLGLGQVSESNYSQFSGELDFSQHGGRQYSDLGPSAHQIHWSL